MGVASKKNSGLGVSSFHALDRALLLKWVWRFISQDGSIWSRVISAMYGTSNDIHPTNYASNWCSILREVQALSSKGFDFVSRFVATRWVKYIPIKINIFTWRACLDRLPTRYNLAKRGVVLESPLCLICGSVSEDSIHILFQCELAKLVFRKICRWWDLDSNDISSFSDWDVWFSTIRLPSKLKLILEGVFYVTWWHIWMFRKQSIFAEAPPRRSVLFDDIISRAFDWCVSRFRIERIIQISAWKNTSSLKLKKLVGVDFPAIVYEDALETDHKISSEPTDRKDYSNLSMEEYIELEAEKARRRG
nr:RNA-directed DNA polymerase, eukaryota [Tanacetum cinerariifolium]